MDRGLAKLVAQELVCKRLYYTINREGSGFPLARKIARHQPGGWIPGTVPGIRPPQ